MRCGSPRWRRPRPAVDLLGCERTAACRGVHRLVGADDEAASYARSKHPLRPHLLTPYTPGEEPAQPNAGGGARGRITTDTGKVLRILSNDLDASAEEIADLYRRRWAIELFFRWVNQILKITRFVGTSENAVRIQIAVALIAFLLLRMAQALQKPKSNRL
jgi:IS4 transposase